LLLNISNIGQPEFARTQLICYRLGNRILQTWGFSNFHMTISGLIGTWHGNYRNDYASGIFFRGVVRFGGAN